MVLVDKNKVFVHEIIKYVLILVIQFLYFFHISIIKSLMSNFFVDIWDVFIVYKIVYKIPDIRSKFSHRSKVV